MTEEIMVHQILLTDKENRELVIWAKTGKKFVEGNFVTLKNSSDPDKLWFVKEIYGAQPLSTIHSDWKVGGLS